MLWQFRYLTWLLKSQSENFKKKFFEFWLINKIFDTVSHPNMTSSLRALHLHALPFIDKISYYDDICFLWNKHKPTNDRNHYNFSTRKLHRQMFLEYWLIKKLFSTTSPTPLVTHKKQLMLTALEQRYALSLLDKFNFYNSFENSYKIWAKNHKNWNAFLSIHIHHNYTTHYWFLRLSCLWIQHKSLQHKSHLPLENRLFLKNSKN